MAASYESDPSMDVKCAIAYEHNLADSIHEFQVKAFPTYILFTSNGVTEHGRIQGADFDGIKKMIAEAGCKMDRGSGNTLGGSGGANVVSMAEARAQRLAMFEKKRPLAATAVAAAATDVSAAATESKKEPTPTGTADADMEDAAQQDDIAEKTPASTKEDIEMKDASPETETETETDPTTAVCTPVEMEDPTEKLSKEDITTLTESMGFTVIRAQKGLLNGGGNVEGAVEWLMNHQDDNDIDEPVAKVPKGGDAVAKSYKCNDCGKVLSNMANLELHANKTGHSDFEESTESVKPLTEEEKAQKIAEIKCLLKAKRDEREELEKVEDVDREKSRRTMGKKMAKTREEMDRQARQREAKVRRKEKEDFKRERARIIAEIQKDKLERKTHHGKLTSKLGVDGYNPDAIQYDVDAEGMPSPSENQHKKIKVNAGKIDEYIKTVSSYKAGGDGGKCLKILLAYVKNVVDKPDEDKFKRINMENKVFRTRVKSLVGAKALLLAVGFSPNDNNDALILADTADRDILAQTKQKLEAAFAAY